MRRLIVIAALLAAFGATAVALAAGADPIQEQVLGAGSVPGPYLLHVKKAGDIVVAKATVPPGASFGWHFHRAEVTAVVTAGTLSLYDSADKTCTARRIAAGHAFIEHRGHVHLARNEGDTPVTVLVTYLGLKHGVNPDVPVASPGNCPF